MTKVRNPAVAGTFYPGDPKELRESIMAYVSRVSERKEQHGRPIGAVAPHAGYMYSGETAAYTYKVLGGSAPECVILIGPSHRDFFEEICVYDGEAYGTPLGRTSVDTRLAAEIGRGGKGLIMGDIGHRMEHALEVQIPFLQMLLPRAKIVPITMGTQRSGDCRAFADILAKVLSERSCVVVASSDLSHFHPYDTALEIDAQCSELVASFDADTFLAALEDGSIEACGGGPMGVTMLVARSLGATDAHILHACNSGDVSGDRSGVVGYLSAVFTEAA